jgi:DNA-directed RNA polymerase beta subunit
MLNERRTDLMNHLRLKEITYVTDYYDSKEHQFVYAFIRFLSNLETRSTQRTESNHCVIKNVVNRHILIQNDVRKIMKEVQNMFIDRETTLNSQRHKVPKLMNQKIFARMESLITHEAIDLIIRE